MRMQRKEYECNRREKKEKNNRKKPQAVNCAAIVVKNFLPEEIRERWCQY